MGHLFESFIGAVARGRIMRSAGAVGVASAPRDLGDRSVGNVRALKLAGTKGPAHATRSARSRGSVVAPRDGLIGLRRRKVKKILGLRKVARQAEAGCVYGPRTAAWPGAG